MVQEGSKGDYLQLLYEYLINSYKSGERVIIIIDEAQGLEPALLEEIRLLSNLETAKSKLLQIILVGQPELNETLSQRAFRQLRQRVNMCYHLPPLSEKETKDYIEKRLRIAGGKESIFTKSAVKEIYLKTKGIPRLINILCDNALLTGYAGENKVINRKIVKEAARDLPLQTPWKLARNLRLFAGLSVIGILIFIAYKTNWSYADFISELRGLFQFVRDYFTSFA
jgi:general secretion pathway protein A